MGGNHQKYLETTMRSSVRKSRINNLSQIYSRDIWLHKMLFSPTGVTSGHFGGYKTRITHITAETIYAVKNRSVRRMIYRAKNSFIMHFRCPAIRKKWIGPPMSNMGCKSISRYWTKATCSQVLQD